MRNLITDVAGITVGCADDPRLASGVTVALFDEPAVASVSVSGGAPAGRDLECLAPDARIDKVDAILFSGGSGFGLDAASGAQAFLRERGRGYAIGGALVPLVPQAICFDLLNGGNKDWGRYPPYREIAYAACELAGADFTLGTAGAGFGATTVNLKGGQGSVSARTPSGHVVGAVAIVNAIGSAVIGDGPHFWAAPFEQGDEFGGLGSPQHLGENDRKLAYKGAAQFATTIAMVATDAVLTKVQANRLATAAHDGLARAINPAHTMSDGDTLFALATGRVPLEGDAPGMTVLSALAAEVVARATLRAVRAARSVRTAEAHFPCAADLD